MKKLPLLLCALSVVANAHITLRSPRPRTAAQKDGPCGALNSTRGSDAGVTTYTAGDTITVTWDETVEHPGYFRIAFDDNGQDFANPTSPGSDAGVILVVDQIPGRNVTDAGRGYTQQVTLPNTPCTNCTLQLIQVMTNRTTITEPDLYFQCADLVLLPRGGGTGGGAAGGTGGGIVGTGGGMVGTGGGMVGTGGGIAGTGGGTSGTGGGAGGGTLATGGSNGSTAGGNGAAGGGAEQAPVGCSSLGAPTVASLLGLLLLTLRRRS